MGLQGLTSAQKETGGMFMHGVTESHRFCSKPDSERNVNLIHAINQVLIQGASLNPSLPSSPSSAAPPHASNAIEMIQSWNWAVIFVTQSQR